MGLLYLDAVNHLHEVQQNESEECIYCTRHSPHPRRILSLIVGWHMLKEQREQALPYAKELLDRGKLFPGVGSDLDLKHEQLWKNLLHQQRLIFNDDLMNDLATSSNPKWT
ncbi:hypothetical protein BV898_10841 [Hypsibius exemplaris]|uniref:Uncharacterized protein n=1 Tax=Hypsibius exemplaris TaxID=2072580 RepID=A0A1W0WI99_HYPEX|nr:hypothetical protein BV898_10841 [Hypsibius exemplaris]